MIVLFLIRVLEGLYFFQATGYHYHRFFKNALSRIYVYFLPSLLFFFFLLNNILINHLVVFVLSIYYIILLKKQKKRLVFTRRIIRLLSLSFFIGIVLAFINIRFLIFPYTTLILSSLILIPIEHFINKSYIDKARDKILSFKGKIIGITGSYGKTSTKNYLYEMLSKRYLVLKSPKSYNTLLGIAKTINENPIELYDFLILEMGASRNGDIEKILDLVTPDFGIITNIGYQHMETFIKVENILKEKALLVDRAKEKGIINIDDPRLRCYSFIQDVISFGKNGDYEAKGVNECSFDLFEKKKYLGRIKTNLLGCHNVNNLLASIALSRYLNVSFIDIKDASLSLKNVEARLEYKKYNNMHILNDSFNANLDGAISAIKELSKYDMPRYIITPGFVEMASYKENHHIRFAEEIMDKRIIPFLVGKKQTRIIQEELKKNSYPFYLFKSFKEAYQAFMAQNRTKACALLIENDLPDGY